YNIENRNKIVVVRARSIKSLWMLCRFKYIFYTHGFYTFVKSNKNRYVVNLYHGMPIKNLGGYDKRSKNAYSFFDYTVATSKEYENIISAVFCVDKQKILTTGLPRNDALVSVDQHQANKI